MCYSQCESVVSGGAHGGSCVALGGKRTASSRASVPQMCILCQEEQELTLTGRSLVLCAYIQRYVKDTLADHWFFVPTFSGM